MRIFSIILLLVGCISARTLAQGIDFFHGTWSEALERAAKEDKLIFVDAFAEWCGPCKRMAASVFPDPKVGAFFNPNFICMKIDMEKPENIEFAGKYPVGSYPTLMFIGADGKIALKDIGARQADQLLEMGKRALGSGNKSEEYQERYDKGERDPEFIYKYVKELNKAGKPSLKITNDYLKTVTDFSTPLNQRFVLEGASEADSRVFDLLVKHKSAIVALEGADKVDSKIELACKNTVQKAIDFKNIALLNEAKTKMKSLLPGKAGAFAFDADKRYYSATQDLNNYFKTISTYQKKEIKGDAKQLNTLARELLSTYQKEPKALQLALKFAKIAATNGGLAEYYLTQAMALRGLGKTKDALAVAKKGLSLADPVNVQVIGQINHFIEELGK